MMFSPVQRPNTLAALLMTAALSGSCGEVPVVRLGPPQQRIMARTWEMPAQTVRAYLLAAFTTRRSNLPDPFNRMTVNELVPPRFSSDWLTTLVDPGEFLADYKRLEPAARRNDLLLDEPTGDRYWTSEYATAAGPVRFRCGFILHFAASAAATIEVYEKVPTVWVGEHWAITKHGIGFGRYHDIRFVEPTMQDRVRILDLLGTIVKERG